MLILKLGQWGRNGSGGPTRKLLLLINTEKCQKLELIFIMQEYMSSEIFINPEETHNLCRNIDHLLMERMRSSGQSVTTSEFSTQVCMDQEQQEFQCPFDRKKSKKKEYKRKKKEKRKEQEESAKLNLSIIINEIYQGFASFQTNKEQIQESLNLLTGGEKFHMFLNDAIKLQVKNMQKQIWDFMQSIIKENSLQKNSDDQQFYLQMIQYIYTQYSKLRQSSQEIQKIINKFMCINSNSDQHKNDQYGLDRSTFKFMIQSDQTIKNLLKICHRRIFPKHTVHLEQVRELAQMISKCQMMDHHYQQDEEATQKSTSVDDEEDQKSGRKKKRRKLKESDFQSGLEDVVKRLNEMVIIDQKRSSCQVSQEWASRLKQKYQQK